MLKKLKIQDYALIRHLDINFDNDFSTLTGETGAGKSILLGALSLVLGTRADSSALNNDNKCIVEAVFKINNYNLKPFFDNNDLDYEHETIIRREITTSGKSRAFINDTPVNLNILKNLSAKLIDIHSQHENLELNDNFFQLKVIDAAAGNGNLLEEYKQTFHTYKKLKKQLEELKQQAQKADADYDYNLFQFNKLNELNLENIDLNELEDELNVLNNSEKIQQNLAVCNAILSGDNEFNILEQLKSIKKSLFEISNVYSHALSLIDRIETITIDLKDIANEIEYSAETVEFNPQRAGHLKEIIDNIYDAMHKFQKQSIDELTNVREDFKNKTEKRTSLEFDINNIDKRLTETTSKLKTLSESLHNKRQKTVKSFIEKILSILRDLGMPHADFVVNIEKNNDFAETGIDRITFLFSSNKGQPAQNISKIASGGEISRLMLSIKSILSEHIALPTIIFDEIDTGVSGEIAEKMALIMKKMAQNMQVISITHLPQIAARGKNHYKIFKDENNSIVETKITKLNNNERIAEIARLLSGSTISQEAVENAKTLINF
jgi:DNA repair protein RecN (Recombination protein N)